MRPTIYLPLENLRSTGSRRASASSTERVTTDRVVERRLWIEPAGRPVDMKDDRAEQTVGDSGWKRTA